MKLVHLGLLASALLLAACQGDDGFNGKDGAPGKDGVGAAVESVNGVTPSRAFPGRTVTLTISGDNTVWEAAPSVSFDDAAITVKSVEVASPTALLVEIEIGEAAAIGSKTITVGDKAFKGFEITEAVSSTLLGGTEQGALAFVTLRNNDAENLFSTYEDSNGNPAGLQVGSAGAGVYAGVQSVEAQSAELLVLVDAQAAATERALPIVGIDGTSFGSAKLTVVERAAEELSASLTGISVGAAGSKLYKLAVPAGGVTTSFAVDATGASSVGLFFLGADGSWEDAELSAATSTGVSLAPGETAYVSAVNLGAAASFDLDVTSTERPMAEAEPNNTQATANVLPLATSTFARLTPGSDVDYFKVTLTESKKIKVVTTGVTTTTVDGFFGPQTIECDNVLRILKADGTVVIAGEDDAYAETLSTAAAVPAGDYIVEVKASSYGVTAPYNDYLITVTAE